MNFSVTQLGKPLDPSKYSWNEETRTFSSNEKDLVLDFTGINGVTFDTRYNCTFDTGSYCTFNTGSSCTFKTGSNCTFDTGSYCTFNTGTDCIFKTGSDCTFITGSDCKFYTESNCVIVRRDIFEIILPVSSQTIKLNEFKVKGYSIINPKRTITIDNKTIEISEESFQNLKQQLIK